MRHRKNFDHLSAISNDLGWTEERFQPPKSHQIVDSLQHQTKSSLFSSLFRTGQSLNLERKSKKQKTRFPKLKSKSRSVRIDEFSRKMYKESPDKRPYPVCARLIGDTDVNNEFWTKMKKDMISLDCYRFEKISTSTRELQTDYYANVSVCSTFSRKSDWSKCFPTNEKRTLCN